ncbi:MAG: ROK family protein, partial [Kiritimatiellia bacterium]
MQDMLIKPAMVPPLDQDFRPPVLAHRQFRAAVRQAGGVPLALSVQGADGVISGHHLQVLPAGHPQARANLPLVERIVKFLLWQRGGARLVVSGPAELGQALGQIYSETGARAFDARLMSDVYGRPFAVETTAYADAPAACLAAQPLGRHLDGCRIGFDLGASDRKVAAVVDGQPVYSEEVIWDPKNQTDPQYHYDEIMATLQTAAKHMPRVDAIGGSAAGIYVNNSVRIASLFRGVPHDLFEKRVRGIFAELQKAWQGIPFDVINDGEVTALAGSMSLGVNRILGIAMGSSLAAGYVDGEGNVVGWLDELAFAPVDYNPGAPADEWSGDCGCGALYFSQVAVNRLAERAGIALDPARTLPERLKDVQQLMQQDDPRARKVYETIGIWFGYTLAHYAEFYDVEHILMLGRVTSGRGGDIVREQAHQVLQTEFPELSDRIKLAVPDEASRR